MRKLFLCLANSKKYGERCVAGIEVSKTTTGSYEPIIVDEKPKWIRPVTRSEHGSIPEEWVKDMHLLEVYEMEEYQKCPQAYQVENVFFAKNSFKKIACMKSKQRLLGQLIETQRSCLFGNRGKAVCADKINTVSYSLTLIRGEKVKVYGKKYRVWQIPQIRIQFQYKGASYDLPITDIAFLEKYEIDATIIEKASAVFITVSLGVDVEGWHYKLAAGIICY